MTLSREVPLAAAQDSLRGGGGIASAGPFGSGSDSAKAAAAAGRREGEDYFFGTVAVRFRTASRVTRMLGSDRALYRIAKTNCE